MHIMRYFRTPQTSTASSPNAPVVLDTSTITYGITGGCLSLSSEGKSVYDTFWIGHLGEAGHSPNSDMWDPHEKSLDFKSLCGYLWLSLLFVWLYDCLYASVNSHGWGSRSKLKAGVSSFKTLFCFTWVCQAFPGEFWGWVYLEFIILDTILE